jgi:hypothetical protein
MSDEATSTPVVEGLSDAPPPIDLKPEPSRRRGSALKRWLLAGLHSSSGSSHHPTYPWWKVMCLTGVDYFSTLGYQPGIAFLAAGVLSPVATLILVAVTLFVALPVYRQVASHSPHGQGSVAMLEELLPRWRGKAFVLVLLGFAFTSFIITITLSAADAAEHIIHNPFVPHAADHPVILTTVLLLLLGAVFLKGFTEAIGLAVSIVFVYLVLNGVLLVRAVIEVLEHPSLVTDWKAALLAEHGSPLGMLAVAALLFPKLALGLSGFETGVAVMPLVAGHPGDDPQHLAGRIRNTRKLLFAAAAIMSVYLIGSSLVTALLIPPAEFAAGGKANGRALAFLAHRLLGTAFGTAYDMATIAILWFAGASAMAGLLNLVPRYLPPYGMAPDWARASRPLVLLFTLINILVTVIFGANVDAQAGAYATGVLAFMTSSAVAVAITYRGKRSFWMYAAMAAIFVYTTGANIWERPEGLKIATIFVLAIVSASLLSRAVRSTELRIDLVELDPVAARFIDENASQGVRIIAHRPDKRSAAEYERKEKQSREDHSLDDDEPILFLEVTQGDASDFRDDLKVRGVVVGDRHRILRCTSPAIPNAIAALLLNIRDRTGRNPDAYFGWTEGNPLMYVFRYLALGEGDTAPLTREVLRKAIRNPLERPRIHVG